jgi:sulfatase modifying factor 1
MDCVRMIFWAVLCCAATATTASALQFDMVQIGNPGNAPDTRYIPTGVGGVGYVYDIGRYEVTSTQYAEFLNKVAGVDTYGLYHTSMGNAGSSGHCGIYRSGGGTAGNPYTYTVNVDRANLPVQPASWLDAARLANWMHNGQRTGAQDATTTEDGVYDMSVTHPYYVNGSEVWEWSYSLQVACESITRKTGWTWAIPTQDEWYKAAHHDPTTGNYYDYATGSNVLPSNSVTYPDLGNNATFTYGGSGTSGAPFKFTDVGEHENSASPWGTFDQNGNAIEWTETPALYRERYYRGGGAGSWVTSSRDFLRADYLGSDTPEVNYGDFGFRLVAIPEPTSWALLGLGGLAMLRRRRA